MAIGRQAFSQLSMHPEAGAGGVSHRAGAGIVRKEDIAALFELDEIVEHELNEEHSQKTLDEYP
jgi:hypothetical protein